MSRSRELLIKLGIIAGLAGGSAASAITPASAESKICPHIVKAGESLSAIWSSKARAVGWKSFLAANDQFPNPSLIYPGNIVNVPCSPGIVMPTEKVVVSPAPITPNRESQKGELLFTVRPGEAVSFNVLNRQGRLTVDLNFPGDPNDLRLKLYSPEQRNQLESGEKVPPKGMGQHYNNQASTLHWVGGNVNNRGDWRAVVENTSNRPVTFTVETKEGEGRQCSSITYIHETLDGGKTYIDWPWCNE